MNLFEPAASQEILSRIQSVNANTPAAWGKMNAAQMMAHCQATFDAYFKEEKVNRGLMSIMFGKMAKKKLFSKKPWPKGLPTARNFVVADERNFAVEKEKLIACIKHFAEEGYTVTEKVHPFFGKMSSQEWAMFGYKHLDHHLKQFGV
jgi:hypothetical protein